MESKILLLNCTKVDFKNDGNSASNVMCKITYGIACSETDYFAGYSVLESYVNVAGYELSKKYLGRLIPATLKVTPTKNGVKYTLLSLNGENI